MNKQIIVLVLSLFIVFTSCKQENKTGTATGKSDSAQQVKPSNDYMILAVLYQQKAAEYKALCFQAFNTAKLMTDKDLADKNIKMKRAIILDIDETVLDNSPYQAKTALENIGYPEKWNDWCEMAQADAVPGAVEFLNYAAKKGIEIFYVSNRKEKIKESTAKNLKAKNFPMVDDQHMLFRANDAKSNSKEERRQKLEKDFHIVLYLGDNLADFNALYDEVNMEKRYSTTDSLNKLFGTKYIVLPNPMYGDWEMALYDKTTDTTAALKASKRRSLLKSF